MNCSGNIRELNIEALTSNLQQVLDHVDACLEEAGCPVKVQMQIDVAVEEIFVNIASYAYAPGIRTESRSRFPIRARRMIRSRARIRM